MLNSVAHKSSSKGTFLTKRLIATIVVCSVLRVNTLRLKYNKLKAVFFDEISMIGRELFKKSKKRLQEIIRTTKSIGGLHMLAIGDFFQMALVMGRYIFKDDHISYGPLAINLWKLIFIFTL